MFDRPNALSLDGFAGSGADWLEYKPLISDDVTIIASPHKTYGPETNDLVLQLRKRDTGTSSRCADQPPLRHRTGGSGTATNITATNSRRALPQTAAMADGAILIAGCGDDNVSPGSADGQPPLTIGEALSIDDDSIHEIEGFIVVDVAGPRVCAALAESFPPQCGEPGPKLGVWPSLNRKKPSGPH